MPDQLKPQPARNSVLRALIFAWFAINFFVLTSFLYSGIMITPTYLIVSSPLRSGAVTVTNASDKDREVWVQFRYGYQVVDDRGKPTVVVVNADSGSPRSASAWLRAYPDRFLLPQNTSQTIRILVTAPAGTVDGEYWARVVVGSKEANPLQSQAARRETKGVNMSIGIIEYKDIPLHYRKGNPTPRIAIRKVSTSILKDTMKVLLDLQQAGNAAYWGNATVRMVNGSGKTVTTLRQGITVYVDEVVPFFMPISKVPPGEYSLDVDVVTEAKGGIKREHLLKVEPLKYSTNITLP